ncbi:MAG: hypothetical protein KAS07_02705 [Candidatus Pacebacteria bacterium]|nr:hypothetical protein [Candidatus Paceibacterota bacterium]
MEIKTSRVILYAIFSGLIFNIIAFLTTLNAFTGIDSGNDVDYTAIFITAVPVVLLIFSTILFFRDKKSSTKKKILNSILFLLLSGILSGGWYIFVIFTI